MIVRDHFNGYVVLTELVQGYIKLEFEYVISDVWTCTFNNKKNFKNYPPSFLIDVKRKVNELINSNVLNDEYNKILIEYQTELEKHLK